MGSLGLPANYLNFNTLQTKNPVIVVDIAGAKDLLTNRALSTQILFGDPNIIYGQAGVVYGGLRSYAFFNQDGSPRTYKPFLTLDGSLSIQQRLEPEQGRGSVSQLNLSFIDYQGYMTQLVSPGMVIDEILGAEVNVYLGYAETSFPGDFFRVFRGYVSAVSDGPGYVNLQISDPNIKRRQTLFFIGTSTLMTTCTSGATSIFINSTSDFFSQITGPDGTFPNPSIHTYMKIDDEWIECTPDSVDLTKMNVTARGARGTTAAAHTAGATVMAGIQVGDSVNQENALDMALKIMLSGWDGPWVTDVGLLAIGPQPDPNVGIPTTSEIQLEAGVDAVQNYGLVAQDWVTISGSGVGGNNASWQIVRFDTNTNTPNNIIVISGILTKEQNTPAVAAFRSQYDVYPTEAGLRMTPKDVDINQHLFIKNTFLGAPGNDLIFFITSAESSGKDFLESQIYFPVGAYSLTRRGLCSCGYHSPPIGSQTLTTLDETNITNPQNIVPSRATNSRSFYNEIDIVSNYDDAGNARTVTTFLDSDSYDAIGILSVLTIDARGVYANYSQSLLNKRAFFLLNRYKRGALIITLSVTWQVISVVEAGDIVAIDDTNGVLQIANFNSGLRDLSGQLFEVIDRTFDIKNGSGSLTLVGGVGATTADRFGVISPSSLVDSGSTATQIIIKDSFGAIFPGNESKKWEGYLGQNIYVHSQDFSVGAVVKLNSIDAANNYMLHCDSLGFSPPSDYVVDIDFFPNSIDPTVDSVYKALHAFWSPTVTVISGSDSTHVTVGGGDIGKFTVGNFIRVHSIDYSSDSGDLTVLGIVGNTIETSGDMGFTPSAGMQIDLVGFPDASNAYRWI